ncbi:amino acid adenylation domain-containing protein [Streptomyces sp. B1866]|uniref:amino acid adenylation domain-containing protein n=1 Tax=Streptomyces sp. B1866 TaxID=3075431 RepID=UPI0028909CD2|nr:amino acid adenylation domain-containing protein [Streptomyces sp. B1866]MDT3395986.1 amino acid adenylation domain-containing protein [Streptomyces sp. B1866]
MTDPTTSTAAAELAAALAALPPDQRAVFERRLRERGVVRDAFPLTAAQRGVWFLEQLRPGNPAYTIAAALRIRGPLDAGVLLRALNEIVRRHEALRTTFEVRDGRPVQVVHPALELDLPETDLPADGVPWDEPTGEELQRRVFAALGGPFDLAAGPLLRVRLLRLGPADRVLALAMHHLVSDGWSVRVLVSELTELYAAFRAGRPSPLPEPGIQYGDFAVWQQRRLAEQDIAAGVAYWRGHLAGAPDVLGLATDRPRPAVQGFRGGSVPVRLPEPLMRELAEVARRHRATPYMALLAVLHTVLHRYSGQDDVVIGVPTANRTRREVEPLIGFFVNTLPVRADLSGDPAFAELLERVREACVGAYTHEELPFERIVEELRVPRDLSRPPVFQACLSYQSDPLPALAMGDVEIRQLPLAARGARFDLELQAFDDAGALAGWFEYDRDLFDAATVARLAGHFRRVAELVARHPDVPVGGLELLDADERHRLVAEWNATAREWPGAGWIHQEFEKQARLRPDAEAVRFEGRSVGYAELNRRANRLAHHLTGLGVGRDVLVGVCLERSPELVVSLLAVLKAGGAYVPLDPGHPPARLAYVMADAAAPVLLTRRGLTAVTPPEGTRVLYVDEPEAVAGRPDHDPDVKVGGEDLAYVIHTSGSTGRPKGVMNVHAAIRNRLLWMQDAYPVGPGDRILQKTPFSFDVSVWEFFWPLMTGATLVVARPDGHRDARYLTEVMRAESVTTAHFVPSMLQVFLTEPRAADLPGLRRVFCSGEALPDALRDRFLAASTAELHNLYGPTEAAVDVTAWACGRGDGPGPVPIGRPIANTQTYVLDGRLRPVPVGVVGELCVGGRNLARGYLNKPELTAERFVPDPFSAAPGARLYRTGDLARWRPDGVLEFLGRMDHQVKVRGLRIEPGEIESVLTEHPGVRQAVVSARARAAHDVRLVAHLTAADGPAPTAAELAAHLRERLPDYMVPSAFVTLPALPLGPNGKVDRAALPEPDGERPDLAAAYVAPGEGLERDLAELWRDLLGVARVGVHDNVFDLGGHSLLMVEFRARLADRLGHRVEMVDLFQYPTVAALAAYLGSAGDAAPALASRGRGEARRLTHDRRRHSAERRTRARNGR